jgi:hypothetical protein
MARPQETFKKREKDMKRREKQERKIQRRLEKKALAQEGDAETSQADHTDQPDGLF